MAQPGKNDQRRKAQGRVYVLTPQDVQASDTVVIGILPLFSNFAKTLFDSGSTHLSSPLDMLGYVIRNLDLWVMTCLWPHLWVIIWCAILCFSLVSSKLRIGKC